MAAETGVPLLVGREDVSESARLEEATREGGEGEGGEGERVQDVPVHMSMEGVISNTHTFESSTFSPLPPTTMTAATRWLIPWTWYSFTLTPTSTTNNEPDSDFPSEAEIVGYYHHHLLPPLPLPP